MSDNSFESETILREESLIDMKDKLIKLNINQMRIVRVSGYFEEKYWCTKNHLGYVLKGEMKLNFDGYIESFSKGNSFSIIDGLKSRHKLIVSKGEYVELLVFEND